MATQRQPQGLDSADDRNRHAVSMITQALDKLVAQKELLGLFVVINTETGEYVTAKSLMDATDQFRSRFPGARGFVRRVGEPLYEPLLLE